MLTGAPPWSDCGGQVQAIFKIGGTGELPTMPDWISDDARNFVSSCLRRRPDERPSAEDLLAHPFVAAAANAAEEVPALQYEGYWSQDDDGDDAETDRCTVQSAESGGSRRPSGRRRTGNASPGARADETRGGGEASEMERPRGKRPRGASERGCPRGASERGASERGASERNRSALGRSRSVPLARGWWLTGAKGGSASGTVRGRRRRRGRRGDRGRGDGSRLGGGIVRTRRVWRGGAFGTAEETDARRARRRARRRSRPGRTTRDGSTGRETSRGELTWHAAW